MKWALIVFSVLFLATALAKDLILSSSSSSSSPSSSSEESEETGGLNLAEPCNEEACQLPDCRCSSTSIPGGLNARDTPQFVTLTFEDGVVDEYMYTFRNFVYNRKNSNGCPTGTTFYVSHEYTDYNYVNELYNQGFEIALHSITHTPRPEYWAEADYETLKKEFADQKVQMSHFANIPADAIKGIRIPYLQLAGNASFQVMADYGFEYDNSWPTTSQVNPGLWPYTLDYASTQDCVNPPCPTASFPGKWVLPVVSWLDLDGTPCAMLHECAHVPDLFFPPGENEWFRFLVGNFERHYLGNRAPFSMNIAEWYFSRFPFVQRALVRFMNMLNNLEDVFMVNSDEVIDWVKNPISVNEYRQKPCRSFTPTTCQVSSCYLRADHDPWREQYRKYCSECPNRFPWLGNPLGE